MTITFVGNGPWGTGVGRPLTVPEHDNNVWDHEERISDLEVTGDGITLEAEYTGGSILFLVDGGEGEPGGYNLGPFALPVAELNPVGPWFNEQTLNVNDLVDTEFGVYLVLIAHTTPASPAEFDPDAVDDEDNPLYHVFSSIVGYLKDRGTFAAVAYAANDVFVHTSHGFFQVLQNHVATSPLNPYALGVDDNPLYRQLAGPPFSPVETVTTDTYDVVLADIGKYKRCTHVDGCVVTFPDDIDFPVNGEIHWRQCSENPIAFVEGGTDVVLNPQRVGFDTSTPWEGATVTSKVVASNEWDLIGPFGDEIT